jgi:hypothetical protein
MKAKPKSISDRIREFSTLIDIYAPKWSDIALFGQSSVARSAYLWLLVVPLTANLFAGVAKIVHVDFFGHKWALKLDLPFSWKLLFLGALLTSAANVLFAAFCPHIIRGFRDFAAFRDSSGSGRRLKNLLKAILKPNASIEDVRRIRTLYLYKYCTIRDEKGNSGGRIDELGRDYLNNQEPSTHEHDYLDHTLPKLIEASDLRQGDLPDAFEFVHEHAEHVRPCIRALVSLLYAVAFAIVIWLIAENAYAVVRFGWTSGSADSFPPTSAVLMQ